MHGGERSSWAADVGRVMPTRFRYVRDPVFLASLALYLLNRWILKPLEGPHGGFFHSYGNALLCIPFCLPPCLWAYRAIGLRDHDRMPTRFEMLAHLIVWSIYFKGVAPRMGGLYAWVVPDPWDVVAYAVGAAVASACWGTFRRHPQGAGREERPVPSRDAGI